MDVSYMCAYEDSIMKSTICCLIKGEKMEEGWENYGGGELVQEMLYACMELSQ
jgi:hypothetical protein